MCLSLASAGASVQRPDSSLSFHSSWDIGEGTAKGPGGQMARFPLQCLGVPRGPSAFPPVTLGPLCPLGLSGGGGGGSARVYDAEKGQAPVSPSRHFWARNRARWVLGPPPMVLQEPRSWFGGMGHHHSTVWSLTLQLLPHWPLTSGSSRWRPGQPLASPPGPSGCSRPQAWPQPASVQPRTWWTDGPRTAMCPHLPPCRPRIVPKSLSFAPAHVF